MIISAESSFVVTIIAVHIAAALLGLVATGTITHLACRRLVFGEPVSDPALVHQLQSLSILALCLVIGSSATLLVLWMELYCIPGDEPMIFRIDLARVPSKTMAKVMLAAVLAVCALAVDRYPLLALRDVSRHRGQSASLREFFELSLFASAPFICWLAITGIALVPALRTWSASSLLFATVTIWLIVLSALLLMSLVIRSQARSDVGSVLDDGGAVAWHSSPKRSQLSGFVGDEAENSPLFSFRDAEIGKLTASVVQDPSTGEYRPVIRLTLPPETNDARTSETIIWHTEAEFIVETASDESAGRQPTNTFEHDATGASSREKLRFRAA